MRLCMNYIKATQGVCRELKPHEGNVGTWKWWGSTQGTMQGNAENVGTWQLGQCHQCKRFTHGIGGGPCTGSNTLIVKRSFPHWELNPHRECRKCRYMVVVGIQTGNWNPHREMQVLKVHGCGYSSLSPKRLPCRELNNYRKTWRMQRHGCGGDLHKESCRELKPMQGIQVHGRRDSTLSAIRSPMQGIDSHTGKFLVCVVTTNMHLHSLHFLALV